MATIEHSTITDPEIHEPKGASTATDGQVYVADGAGSGAWTDPDDLVFTSSSNTFDADLEVYKSEGSSSFSGGAWTDRSSSTAWTVADNNIASASVSTSNISLPAGTYVVDGYTTFIPISSTTANGHGECLTRLKDVTGDATLLVSSPAFVGSAAQNELYDPVLTGGVAILKGRFTIGSTKTVRLQHFAEMISIPQTGNSSSAENMVTSYLRFWKIV